MTPASSRVREEAAGTPVLDFRRPSMRVLASASQLMVLAALTTAIFSDPLLRLIESREVNVYAHVEFARRMVEQHVFYPGHFLFHLLTAAVHATARVSWLQANFLIEIAFRILLAVVVWRAIRQASGSRDSFAGALTAIAMTLGLLGASAISFFSWPQGNYYLGYLVPNIYVSQTFVVLQPLALLTFFAVVRVFFGRPSDRSAMNVSIMGLLGLLSTLAKPSFVMVLLPALAVLLVFDVRWPMVRPSDPNGPSSKVARRWRALGAALVPATALVVPVLAGMVWIYLSTYLVYQRLDVKQDAGFRIAPFKVMAYFQSLYSTGGWITVWLPIKLGLSIVFPSAVALAYFSRVRRDPRFVLAWVQFGFGLVFTYLFAESPSFQAGNFTWSGDIAVLILFVVSAVILVEQTLAGTRDSRRSPAAAGWAVVCYAAFLLHVAAGYGMFMHPAVN